MAHYAKVEDGVVTQVIVANSQEWCEANLGGTWIQTSYNTRNGVNTREGGIALHKNYAGIGFIWDGIGFHTPQPYPSWTLNEETYEWDPPTPKPHKDSHDEPFTMWDEDEQNWIEHLL